MKNESLLIVADSDRDANLLYATRIFTPDPFVYLRKDGKSTIIVSDLEFDRARRTVFDCRVVAQSEILARLRKKRRKPPTLALVIKTFLKEQEIKRVTVPTDFPLGLARQIRELGIKIHACDGPFWPEREIKTADEIKKISAALLMAEVGLSEGIQVLRRAKITRSGRLTQGNIQLTVEKLRGVIETAIVQAGGVAARTIVACGDAGCDPHERGTGLLKANQTIVIDVFPRSQMTGYYGDITRTVVRGRASDELHRMYNAVLAAQDKGLELIQNGQHARAVHRGVQDLLAKRGFKTSRAGGKLEGFFHGTGHGVGLDLHESPAISSNSKDILRSGQVVTVEPGLYYRGLGAVRLEDMAVVMCDKGRNLTKFEKVLEV